VRALAIAIVNTKRFLRERSNVFFVFIFPLLIVLLIGVAFGAGFDSTIGVYVEDDGGALVEQLVTDLGAVDGIETEPYDDPEAMADAVQRGTLQGGLIVPAGYDAAASGDDVIELELIIRPDGQSQLIAETVRSVVGDQAIPIRAARFVAAEGLADFDVALTTARGVADTDIGVSVSFREVGESVVAEFENLGAFDLGAHQELVLFVFVTSTAGSAALIQSRQYGVSRRMIASPTPIGTILVGETLGRFGVALVQGVYIMLGTLIVFGVAWGDPLGAIALLVMFCIVGASVGILFGALFSNDQQAGGMGVLIALGLAALGGAMVPIEIFPDTMATIARATPHAWAIDGFAELVRRDGTLVDILPNLGVLTAFAAVIMAIGAWRLRSVLTH
jgi:ABC-2 type transport system permease protein